MPWYIFVGIETQGEWIDQFFFKHNISRYTNTMEGHGGFPMASLVILLGGLMPFSFFLPQSIRLAWKEWRNNSFIRFCSIASLVVVVFFSFSSTILPTYPEPAFPFAAILIGIFFEKLISGKINAGKPWVSGALYVLIAMIMPPAAFLALKQDQTLSDLAFSTAIAFIVIPMGAVAGLFYLIRLRYESALLMYSGSLIIFLLAFFYILFPKIDSRNPVTESLSLFNSDRPVVCYKDFNPAYIFALKHSITQLNSLEDLKHFRLNHPEFFLVTEKIHVEELEGFGLAQMYEGKNLFEDPVTVVLTATDHSRADENNKASTQMGN
jgi:hypothetical protein